jgi:hypothetical protein
VKRSVRVSGVRATGVYLNLHQSLAVLPADMQHLVACIVFYGVGADLIIARAKPRTSDW